MYHCGSRLGETNSCFKLSGRILKQDSLVKCVQEEADDRIMFHVNNAVKVDKFSKVHIHILVCALSTSITRCTLDWISF